MSAEKPSVRGEIVVTSRDGQRLMHYSFFGDGDNAERQAILMHAELFEKAKKQFPNCYYFNRWAGGPCANQEDIITEYGTKIVGTRTLVTNHLATLRL